MTDKQIIKAVGICRTLDTCRGCPYHELDIAWCVCALMKDVFDLINRQKAEIKRLNKNIDGLNIFTTNHMKVIRVQSIKEFAERLRNKIWYSDWCNFERSIPPEIITNLVKEMTEVQK